MLKTKHSGSVSCQHHYALLHQHCWLSPYCTYARVSLEIWAIKLGGSHALCFHRHYCPSSPVLLYKDKRTRTFQESWAKDWTCFVYNHSTQVGKMNNVILVCTIGLTWGREHLEYTLFIIQRLLNNKSGARCKKDLFSVYLMPVLFKVWSTDM